MGEAPEAGSRPSGLRLPVTLWRIERPAAAQKRLRTASMWCVPTRSSAPKRLCRDGALHQSLGVDPVITPAYHRVRNTGVIRRRPCNFPSLARAIGFGFDHVEHLLAERPDHLPGVDRPIPRII